MPPSGVTSAFVFGVLIQPAVTLASKIRINVRNIVENLCGSSYCNNV